MTLLKTTLIKTAPLIPVRTAPVSPRSPHHLTEEQIAFFDENGYLILRHWIAGPLLERLQSAATGWISQGWQMLEDKSDDTSFKEWDADWAFAEREGNTVMWRVNYLHDKGESASLELLGSPEVLAVAESLCGPNLVPTYESMVFKQQGDGKEVVWHQDAIHPRTRRIFNLDVYLDFSREGAGALLVVPKSQRTKQDFCDLEHTYGWAIPDALTVEMEPGDVLLHDVMLAHGSPATHGSALRRTLYYEFRSSEEILEDGPWDREWIERRMRLVPLALEAHAAAFPDAQPFDWRVTPEFRPTPGTDRAAELKVIHEVHTPAAFCSAGDAVKLA